MDAAAAIVAPALHVVCEFCHATAWGSFVSLYAAGWRPVQVFARLPWSRAACPSCSLIHLGWEV